MKDGEIQFQGKSAVVLLQRGETGVCTDVCFIRPPPLLPFHTRLHSDCINGWQLNAVGFQSQSQTELKLGWDRGGARGGGGGTVGKRMMKIATSHTCFD